jgi:CHAT domain-containing protein
LRTKDDAGIPTKTEAVVVGDPAIAKDLKRKFPGLVPLPGAREEALEVSKVWGAATVLLGPDATKPAVLKHLAGARRFYVAAHHERDRATPYIRFLPLAADPTITDLSGAFVEAADILALDLRGCNEVVLAGCSSGAPYVDGSRVAPGFGEAFLDAGAEVVVQALWRVEDRDAAELIQVFLVSMTGDGKSGKTPQAFEDTVRQTPFRGGGFSHPFYFAPYQIVAARIQFPRR